MARALSGQPYFVTVVKNAQKAYPEYIWSTERRQLDGEWVRTLSGRRGHFILAVQIPDKPTVLRGNGKGTTYWRAAADLIVRRINEGELKYGQNPTMDEQKDSGKAGVLLRREDAGGDDDRKEVGKDDSTRPDGDGEPTEVRGQA